MTAQELLSALRPLLLRAGPRLTVEPKGLERLVRELTTRNTAADLYAMTQAIAFVIEAISAETGGKEAAGQLASGLLDPVLAAVMRGAKAEVTERRSRAQPATKAPPMDRPKPLGVRTRR